MRNFVTYQFDPAMQPDSEFVPGTLAHLVVGNEGRLLDPRRTPIRIVGLVPATGEFVVEILAFEDRGARWEVPYEEIDRYQFPRGSAEAVPSAVGEFEEAVRRFDEPLEIPADARERDRAEREILELRHAASEWLETRSRFLASGEPLEPRAREGIPALWADLRAFMEEHALWDVEDAIATQYVRNPHSGELVKGHRMVLAELGLAAFAGKKVRDPALFSGAWSRARRRKHILARLAFVRALFAKAGRPRVVLYRGLSWDGLPEPPRNGGLVSATFDLAVATSHFEGHGRMESGLLLRQAVPVERLFMSCLETVQMNEHYKEGEAVLFGDSGNQLF